MPELKEDTLPTGHQDPARQPRSVHVRFSHSEGQRLRRSEPTSCPGKGPIWVERPVLMERADGTFELIGTTRNLEGLARWVLSFGTNAEVCSPPKLRRRVCKTARRIQCLYDEDAT